MKQPLVGGLEQEIYFSIYIGNNHPNWLIFFRGVETTNQTTVPSTCFPTRGSNHLIDSLICGWIAWEKRSSRYCGSWFSFLWAGKSFWNPGSPVNPHACHAQPFLPMGMSNEKTKVVMVYYWAYLMISPWYRSYMDDIYWYCGWFQNPAPPWMFKTPLNNWINHLLYHLVKDFAGPSTVCIGLKFPVESHGRSLNNLPCAQRALQVFAWLRDHMGVTCELFASPLWGLPKGDLFIPNAP